MTEWRLVSLAAALTNSEPERPRLPQPLHFLSLQRADASTQFSTPFGPPAPSHEVAGGILRNPIVQDRVVSRGVRERERRYA